MTSQVPKGIIAVAFVGAVLASVYVLDLTSNTPVGRALSFLTFGVAMYPVARLLWFPSSPRWRYWVALTTGTLLGLGLDLWRTGHPQAEQINRIALMGLAGTLVAGVGWLLMRGSRSHRRQ